MDIYIHTSISTHIRTYTHTTECGYIPTLAYLHTYARTPECGIYRPAAIEMFALLLSGFRDSVHVFTMFEYTQTAAHLMSVLSHVCSYVCLYIIYIYIYIHYIYIYLSIYCFRYILLYAPTWGGHTYDKC